MVYDIRDFGKKLYDKEFRTRLKKNPHALLSLSEEVNCVVIMNTKDTIYFTMPGAGISSEVLTELNAGRLKASSVSSVGTALTTVSSIGTVNVGELSQ